jgi:hypothetical protein
MQLSEHFTLEEFERTSKSLPNRVPPDVVPTLQEYCDKILDPIRAHFRLPIIVTSGYRSFILNHLVGGSHGSYHVATIGKCAADIQVPDLPLKGVFDWLREQSGLLFDAVILERGKDNNSEADDCVHVQFRSQYPRRTAFLGPTHGNGHYIPMPVAA